MNRTLALIAAASLCSVPASAQVNVENIVDLELLTHTEVSQKLKDGWTSILLVTGGTEERGPQDVLGGHNIMAHSHAVMIAKRLGKTLVAPVLPVAVNATGLREGTDQPGAIQQEAAGQCRPGVGMAAQKVSLLLGGAQSQPGQAAEFLYE